MTQYDLSYHSLYGSVLNACTCDPEEQVFQVFFGNAPLYQMMKWRCEQGYFGDLANTKVLALKRCFKLTSSVGNLTHSYFCIRQSSQKHFE